jgi:hypothetical protein
LSMSGDFWKFSLWSIFLSYCNIVKNCENFKIWHQKVDKTNPKLAQYVNFVLIKTFNMEISTWKRIFWILLPFLVSTNLPEINCAPSDSKIKYST